MFPNSVAVRRHVDAGGTAYVPRDGWIIELSRESRTRLIEISSIPATFGGAARFNIANSLAAIAACRGMGAAAGLVRHALADFDSNGCNHGRLNVFELPLGRVVLDYGHNPAAIEAVGQMMAALPHSRLIGVVAIPGDRDDALIQQAGRAAARMFDTVILKEDEDTRGRSRGEVAALLRSAVAQERREVSCTVVLDESAAVREAISHMQQDDVVVVFYDQPGIVRSTLSELGAVPLRRPLKREVSAQKRYGT
jgi:cyanophycin synthetase